MNPLNPIDPLQHPQAWSAQLGELSAGRSPTKTLQRPPEPVRNAAAGRFAAALALLRPKSQAQQDAEKKLLCNEFMSGV